MNKQGKTSGAVWALIVGVFILVGLFAYSFLGPGFGQQAAVPGAGPNGQAITGSVCSYQPTATYEAKDKYSTTVISGTSYYKVDADPAQTTAYTNVNSGDKIQYWVQNTSRYYVEPSNATVTRCTNAFNADGIRNGTATLTAYDTTNSRSIDNGVANISMGANAQANIRYTYQPTARQGFMPFGGVLVLEQNSSIPGSGVACNAPFLSSNTRADAFTVTYTVAATTNAFVIYRVAPSIEDGSGSAATFTCQYGNGANPAGAGAAFYATLIPANYYITNDGDILLDVEQAANDLSTRTGLGQLPETFYWGA